jgi:16S rRNA (cytosine1402-N4)-methyltransferase
MRMDQSRTLTAEKIVNTYEEHELTRILRNYGELDNAKGVARTIIQSRPIFSSQGLMDTLNRTAPRGKEHKFYAQLFQALRIEVNEEIAVLEEFLQQSAQLLKPEGRLVIISYHSLEDRPVKDFLKTGNFEGTPEKDFYGNLLRPMKPLHTKPILPSQEEIDINNRARSAKLRIGIKL